MSETNKNPYERQNRYHKKAYDNLNIRIRKDGNDGLTLDEIIAAAEAVGESQRAFVIQAVKERIEQMR